MTGFPYICPIWGIHQLGGLLIRCLPNFPGQLAMTKNVCYVICRKIFLDFWVHWCNELRVLMFVGNKFVFDTFTWLLSIFFEMAWNCFTTKTVTINTVDHDFQRCYTPPIYLIDILKINTAVGQPERVRWWLLMFVVIFWTPKQPVLNGRLVKQPFSKQRFGVIQLKLPFINGCFRFQVYPFLDPEIVWGFPTSP